jgi:endo-1,4-beta-xylanase
MPVRCVRGPFLSPALTRRGLAAAALLGAVRPGLAQAQPPGLGVLARQNGITFGAAVQGGLLATDADYATAFQREVAMLVPEWEGKWGALQPLEGQFDTAPLDSITAWAKANGRLVRGHALIWHQNLPAWAAEALAAGRDRALAVMQAHIRMVLGHTRLHIRDWDVVNEVVADPAGSDTPQQGDSELRHSPFLRALGPSYIDEALRVARRADPLLRLTLNEYGIEEDTPAADEKRRRLLALVRGLLSRGVPLDAVGLQGHLQLAKPFRPEPLTALITALRQAGLSVLITELDIREAWDAPRELAARDALVAERAHAFVSTALAAGVRTVFTWGLSDKYSWLASDPAVAMPEQRTHRGLPLNDRFRRNAMWDALARAFAGK